MAVALGNPSARSIEYMEYIDDIGSRQSWAKYIRKEVRKKFWVI